MAPEDIETTRVRDVGWMTAGNRRAETDEAPQGDRPAQAMEPAPPQPAPPQQDELFRAVSKRAADADPDLREHLAVPIRDAGEAQSDYLYATPGHPHQPQEIFPRLRWGGQFLFASPSRRQVRQLADAFAHDGLEITQPPKSVCQGWCRLPLLSRRVYYFV